MTERRYSCIESFCGAGGFSLGLEQAGLHILTAFDSNEKPTRKETGKRGQFLS